MKFFRFCMLLGVTAYAASALGQTGADSKPLVQFSNPPELGTPNGYSYVAVVTGGKIVFISGQVGLNKQGEMAGKNDFRAQAMQAFSTKAAFKLENACIACARKSFFPAISPCLFKPTWPEINTILPPVTTAT